MEREETQLQFDARLEQALDRLDSLVVPDPPNDGDFVSGVMRRVHGEVVGGSVAVRRSSPRGRRLVRLVVGVSACGVIALGLWSIAAPHRSPAPIAAGGEQKGTAAPSALAVEPAPVEAASAEAAPAIRKSTWTVVTEGVVLEGDMPVRKLLYREFERVEVLDAQGNPESSLVLPTKAMLVTSDERY